MADTGGNTDDASPDDDMKRHKMSRKKTKQNIVRNLIAFITTLILVAVYLHFRPNQNVRIRQKSFLSDKIHLNQTSSIQNSKQSLFRTNHRNDKRLADAMWTMEPDISNPESTNKLDRKSSTLREKHIHSESNAAIKGDSLDKSTPAHTNKPTTPITTSSDTTPVHTNKPTTPITTSSDTTPIYTQSPTTPITTESITTPRVTAPGGDPEITTEANPGVDDDPNETMKLIRIRRNFAQATPTTEDPRTSSVAPLVCVDMISYQGPFGDCQCPPGNFGFNCDKYMGTAEVEQQEDLSVTYTTTVNGQYDDSQRADFQRELEAQYSDLEGFVRIFVFPLAYNSTSNRTDLSYVIFYDETTNPEDIDASASRTSRIITHTLPIVIEGRNVVFGENETLLVRDTVEGEVYLIPIGAIVEREVCYIYDKIDACGSLNQRGRCVDRNGSPACVCGLQYVGEYCNETIQFSIADEETELLEVLLPVLSALAGAVLLCTCCFYICLRRTNRDEPESDTASTVTDFPRKTMILPRYRPVANWKEFLPGPEAEEGYEAYSNATVSDSEVEVQPVIVDRPVIVERVVERPIYIEKREVVVKDRPVMVEERPVLVEERPVLVEERPVLVEERPVLAEERPVLVEEHPVWFRERPRFHERRSEVIESMYADSRSNFGSEWTDLQREV